MRGQDRLYFDFNATAPVRPAVAGVVAEALTIVGNPSSIHAEGRQARRLVEDAREKVAALVGARSRDVIFTSGGTEAAAMVLAPMIERHGDKRPLEWVAISAVEHACLQGTGRFSASQRHKLDVDADGIVSHAQFEALAQRHGETAAPLVAVQLANNETGVLQEIAPWAEAVHRHGGVLVCDAVQAAGKMPLDIKTLGADALILSGHKLGGPKGVGALVINGERIAITDPLIPGGGQERGQRGGTENVPGIVGFGAAAEEAMREVGTFGAAASVLRDRLEAGIANLAPDAVIFGRGQGRLPNTTLFSVPGLMAETFLIAFDLEGVAVSSGSACSSGKVGRSHVLDAMGVEPELASGAIRVSLGWTTEEAHVVRFLQIFEKVLSALSNRRKRQAA